MNLYLETGGKLVYEKVIFLSHTELTIKNTMLIIKGVYLLTFIRVQGFLQMLYHSFHI